MLERPWKHKNILDSFRGALRGLYVTFKTERNAKLMFLAGILALIAGIAFNVSFVEFITIIIVITIVFACETVNTVVEIMLDLLIPHHDPHVKIIKDIASGVVFVACLNAVVIGALIFLPKIIVLLQGYS